MHIKSSYLSKWVIMTRFYQQESTLNVCQMAIYYF